MVLKGRAVKAARHGGGGGGSLRNRIPHFILGWNSAVTVNHQPLAQKHLQILLFGLGSWALASFAYPPESSSVSRGRRGVWDESRCPGQRGRFSLPHWLGEGAGPRAGFRLRGTGRLQLCSGSRWGGAWGVGTVPATQSSTSRLCPGIREWSSCRAGGPRRRWPRGWFGLQVACAPSGRGSPLRGRSSCAFPGDRLCPISAAEANDRQCAFLKRDHDGPQGDA